MVAKWRRIVYEIKHTLITTLFWEGFPYISRRSEMSSFETCPLIFMTSVDIIKIHQDFSELSLYFT